MDLYMRKEKKVCALFTAADILLLASTFVVVLGSLQLPGVNMKAFAQSSTSIMIGSTSADNAPRTDSFNLTSGYRIEPIVWNLTLPSSITFDNENNMYIAEAGFVYGGLIPTPRILKVDNQSGAISVLVDRNLNGPITDIEFYNGKLYVSHRGIISTVELQTGLVKDIIVGLPSIGDHHNNQIAIGGPDNRIYFGQGEATNSGVVGEDNFRLGWAKTAPYFHDIPAKNITLTGQNFVTKNPLTAEPNDNATTVHLFHLVPLHMQDKLFRGI